MHDDLVSYSSASVTTAMQGIGNPTISSSILVILVDQQYQEEVQSTFRDMNVADQQQVEKVL